MKQKSCFILKPQALRLKLIQNESRLYKTRQLVYHRRRI